MIDRDQEKELRERPMGELLRQLSQETTLLVRQEIELAKAEMTEKGKRAGLGAGMFGAAGVIALAALGALTACLIFALSKVMDPWAAALVVTFVYAIVAGVLALSGKKKFQQAAPLVPKQTVETVKEDVQWAKSQVRSGGK